MTTEETAYDYHCREFSEFYEENQKEFHGDDKSKWQDKEEFAQNLFDNYENDKRLQDGTPVWDFVSYSAGIFLEDEELLGDGGVPIHPKHPPRFLNKNTDTAKVVRNLNSPDAHADDACEALQALVETAQSFEFIEEGLTPEDFRPLLSPWFALTCPQYKVVLGVWNSHLNDEELEEFAIQSHIETLENYL